MQAYQFVQINQTLLREAPLHIHRSALVFSPRGVPLFETYRKQNRSLATYVMDSPVVYENTTLLVGLKGWVLSMVFSPNDTRLATMSENQVRLWDTVSGADIAGPMKHDGSAKWLPGSMAFSLDGSKLVVGYARGNLALWDGISGKLLSVGHVSNGRRVSLVTFGSNDSMIASASPREKCIRLWDVTTGGLIYTSKDLEHDGNVLCFSISPDGTRIVSSSDDGKVTLWNIKTRESVSQTGSLHPNVIRYIAFSPDGEEFITASLNGEIWCWDGVSGKFETQLTTIDQVEDTPPRILFSPCGRYLAANGDGAALWKRDTGIKYRYTEIGLSDAHSGDQILSFSPDGNRLGSVLDTGEMQIWETEIGEMVEIVDFQVPFADCTISHAFTSMALSSEDGVIRLLPISTESASRRKPRDANSTIVLQGIQISPDKEIVATATDSCTLQLWSTETGKTIGREITGHTDLITSIEFSPDGQLLSSGSLDGGVKLWSISDGDKLLNESKQANEYVVGVPFSANGKMLAAGWESPGLIHIWDLTLTDGSQPVTRFSCPKKLKALSFSHDSEELIISQTGSIVVRRISDGNILTNVQHFYASSNQVVISPDKSLIAMLLNDNQRIMLWDIRKEPKFFAEVASDQQWWSGARLYLTADRYLVFGSSVWEIGAKNLHRTGPSSSMVSFTSNSRSLLSFHDGWIYSATIAEGLLAIPRYLRVDGMTEWSACGGMIAFATSIGKPLVVNCSPMLE